MKVKKNNLNIVEEISNIEYVNHANAEQQQEEVKDPNNQNWYDILDAQLDPEKQQNT